MPELPEAETIARQIRGHLAGARLGTVRHLRSDMVHGSAGRLRRALPNRLVQNVTRRGKRVALELEGGLRLVIGLGMSGHVSVVPAGEKVPEHTHLRVALADGKSELRFRDARRFGGLWLIDGDAGKEHAGFVRLGPEPLALGLGDFRRIMSRKRQVKALLMDQSAIAGLGNIYCDEALYRAQVHPLSRSSGLDAERVRRLHRSIRRVLTEAIAAEGSSVNSYLTARGDPGSFQYRLRVYGRDGEPCIRCGAEIERILAAGRSTHFCPRCQRASSEVRVQKSETTRRSPI